MSVSRKNDIFNDIFKLNFESSNHTPRANVSRQKHGILLEVELPGFSKSDIVLTIKEGVLMVEGGSKESKSDNYIHKGIAARTFEQKFALGEYVEVKGATMENGILTIFLEREIPEEKKPKIITIK
jgi:molecular chaperone IbpA